MKFNARGQGQRNRKSKKVFAELFVMGIWWIMKGIWWIMKWTIFLPFTLLYVIFKKK